MSNPKYKRLYTENHTVMNTDTFDRERFLQLTSLSSKLNDVAEKQTRKNVSYLPLMGDMWSSLYKMKPHLKSTEGEHKPNNLMNHELMQRVLEDDEYAKMRLTTKLDDFSSAIGSMRMTEVVTEWIDEQKSNEELQKQLNELNQKMKEQAAHGDKKETKNQKEKNVQLQNDISDLQNQVQEQLHQAIEQNGSSFSDAIAKAHQQTKNAKEDLEDLLGGGNGAGSGDAEMKKIPLREQISLAETLKSNKKLKDIAEWAGKFKSIARKKQKSKHTESLDRSGMTLGADVERLLPQELALLSKEGTKNDFLRRFAEGQTMMYSPKGKETLGKGPIVMCLDQSGSMTSLDAQSKGFVLALAMIAKKQRRDFCVITFSVKVSKLYLYEKGKITPNQLVELATEFAGGGTHYGPPLIEAMNVIEKYKRFNKADLIFVTDGEPSDTGTLNNKEWMQNYLNRKKVKQVQILSLLIGNGVSNRWIKSFSDRVVRAADFDKEETTELFTI
ncbi:vWA domain-containing protein [Psychrobacillus sp. FSL H8-0487]|uniref:vWA domain-containing protein n=1 Tax=Psychrobacillus sp. FSL H8-0487 TaxID=2921391 RepID=UPI0030F5E846